MTTTGEALAASQEATLVIELFLNENYRFRRNILNGKVEFAILPKETGASLSGASDEAELIYRPLTQAALNSIAIRAKREQVLERAVRRRRLQNMCSRRRFLNTILFRTFWTVCPNGTVRTTLRVSSDAFQASRLSS